MSCNQGKAISSEIRGIVKRTLKNHELQSRDKGVRIGVSIGANTQAHDLPLSQENPFVERRVSISVIPGGIDDAPEGPIEDLIEHRRRGVVGAVDSAVEVGGPHQILCAAIHGNIVAVLIDSAREGAKGVKSGEQNRGGHVQGGARRDEGRVGEPSAVLELGRGVGPAVDEKASGGCLGKREREEEENE